MIGQRRAWKTAAFEALTEHLGAFGDARLRQLAARQDLPDASPQAVAMRWCLEPERLHEVVRRDLGSARAHRLLEELILEHDLGVTLEWVEPVLVRRFIDLGLVPPPGGRQPRPLVFPGALAVILAPLIEGSRPSLPLLTASMSDEQIARIAACHGVPEGPRVVMLLELAERLADPEALEALLDRLADPDWIGGALRVIELGGLCYWREVFCADLQEEGFGEAAGEGGGQVVPLLSRGQAREERELARALLDEGLIYTVEGPPEADQPMVAVPEVLWPPLWSLGRTWYLDWFSHTLEALEGAGVGGPSPLEDHLQARLKWLCCEASSRRLELPLRDDQLDELARTSGLTRQACRHSLALGVELEVLAPNRAGYIAPQPSRLDELDAPRQQFVQRALAGWCTGRLGAHADRHVNPAIGLDETWRQQVLGVEFIQPEGELLPPWLIHEGVDSGLTGTGYLRELAGSTHSLLMLELGMVNSYVWSLKLLWLDALSLLPSGRSYPLGGLTELLQSAAALAFFHHLSHVLEHPELANYLPIQRASFLGEPNHLDAFDAWCVALLEEVLEPLGVAARDGDRVWLRTRHVRVPSPPGVLDSYRVDLARELVDDPEFDFEIPSGQRAGLRPVPSTPPAGERALGLETPTEQLLERARDRDIVGYDGHQITLST